MNILSYDEESKLSPKERIEYYQRLKEYLANYKESLLKSSYINGCACLNKYLIRKVIDNVKGYELTILGQDNIPEGPVIYASTHQDYHDHFNVVLSIPEHSIILNTNSVTPLFKILLGTNGIVYVDRNNPESRFASKTELMKYLAKGKSIVMFPEATFNCSPNKLHLPLYSGIIDIAKKMQVPIVPLIQEYVYRENESKYKCVDSCHVEFGNPIYVRYNDSTELKKEELSEQFASIRWKLIEQKGQFAREFISNQEYINYVLSRIDGWKQINVKIDDERKVIKGYGSEPYAFSFINDVSFDEYGNLLLPKETIKIINLNETHLDYYNNQDEINVDKELSLLRINKKVGV